MSRIFPKAWMERDRQKNSQTRCRQAGGAVRQPCSGNRLADPTRRDLLPSPYLARTQVFGTVWEGRGQLRRGGGGRVGCRSVSGGVVRCSKALFTLEMVLKAPAPARVAPAQPAVSATPPRAPVQSSPCAAEALKNKHFDMRVSAQVDQVRLVASGVPCAGCIARIVSTATGLPPGIGY